MIPCESGRLVNIQMMIQKGATNIKRALAAATQQGYLNFKQEMAASIQGWNVNKKLSEKEKVKIAEYLRSLQETHKSNPNPHINKLPTRFSVKGIQFVQ